MGAYCCNLCDDSESEANNTEQTRLLRNPMDSNTSTGYLSNAWSPVPPISHDELGNILRHTAEDFIDMGDHSLEPHEYISRCRKYGMLVAQLPVNPDLPSVDCLPIGVAAPFTILSAPLLSHSDIQLITTASESLSASICSIEVQQKIELVVPFVIS